MARVFGELELANVRSVLESGKLGWNEGGMVTRFEQEFAKHVGAKFAIARNSAMTALAQAVSVSGAGTGFEVLCDPIVHFGGVAALSFNAVPRFVDVRYDTYLMDPRSLRANITEKTKALIVTNLWGLCAELDEIRSICDEHGIFMIEDCAHNMGSTWKGRHAGTYGDLGVFSFQQGKHLPTGDGGMMITDREDLHYKLYHEWAFSGESPAFLTLNFRMNELTAAVGAAQLTRVDGYLVEYARNLRLLNEAIAGCAWLRPRTVPREARQSGYYWACLWEGDKHGLKLDDFKRVCGPLEDQRTPGASTDGVFCRPMPFFCVFMRFMDRGDARRAKGMVERNPRTRGSPWASGGQESDREQEKPKPAERRDRGSMREIDGRARFPRMVDEPWNQQARG